MAETTRTADPEVDPGAPSRGVIIRDCVLCGADDAETRFTFTRDFLIEVRDHSPAYLDRIGWDDGTTSSIVRCRRCGAHYVRDVVPAFEQATADLEPSEEAVREQRRRVESHRNFEAYDELFWKVRSLLHRLVHRQGRDLRVLDFGAGSGRACNMARALGVRDVVAYDPYGAYGEEAYRRINFPGILFTRDADALADQAPFDLVVCQTVIEHVLDPQAELDRIHDVMAPGGYLYINNPTCTIEAEIEELGRATRIRKEDPISHYHPGHLNYLDPRQFGRLLDSTDFDVTPLAPYAPAPLLDGSLRRHVTQRLKVAVRTLQNLLHLPYDRYVYIARRP